MSSLVKIQSAQLVKIRSAGTVLAKAWLIRSPRLAMAMRVFTTPIFKTLLKRAPVFETPMLKTLMKRARNDAPYAKFCIRPCFLFKL